MLAILNSKQRRILLIQGSDTFSAFDVEDFRSADAMQNRITELQAARCQFLERVGTTYVVWTAPAPPAIHETPLLN